MAFALPIALALGASQLGCGAVQTDGGGGPLEAGSQGDGRTNSSSSSSDAATASDVVVRADGGVTETVERTLCKSDLDCVRSDAVGTCVALVGGTFHVCAFPPAPPQPCVDAGVPNGQFENECCGKTTNPCLTGVCTLQVACGGAFFVPHNVCVSDECSKNAAGPMR